MTPIFPARVTEEGAIRLRSPLQWHRQLKKLAGKDVDLVVRPVRSQRSKQANAYYWGVVVKLMAEEFGYEPQEMHEALAMKFLRMEDCPITGSPRRRRTPECDTADFAVYVDQCIRLAAEHGVYVPQPGEVEFA